MLAPVPADVFVSYAPEDTQLWNDLEKHLAGLLTREVIATWSAAKVRAGDDWQQVAGEHLDSARLILLLLSADFFASQQLVASTRARVIAIRVRPFDWDAVPLPAHVTVLPTDGKAVTTWQNPELAWVEVAAAIRGVVTALGPRPVAQSTPHNLPPRRLFVGRKDELQRVDQALRNEGRTSIAQAAVWGLGGVGKTALALAYAYHVLDAGTRGGQGDPAGRALAGGCSGARDRSRGEDAGE
jgi:hypothetical protein